MNNEGKNKRKLSEKTKWIITGALCVLAVLTVVIVALDGCFDFKPGSVQANNQAAEESAAPESDDKGSKAPPTWSLFPPATAARPTPTAV